MRIGWARRMKAYHRVHHQFPDRNYGVTMRFWDTVFGTRHVRPTVVASSNQISKAVSLEYSASRAEVSEASTLNSF
jgi:sterol desaturase/sphingolipid hydroxylase (fatty acid hydroxylase superfamily)